MGVKIKEKQVNIAVQVLPFSKEYDVYPIVDEAIRIIKESGVKHRVTPFETVMEGQYGALMDVVAQVQEVCYEAGADSVLCFVKIQSHCSKAVTIEDKTGKYDK